jgi:hypothetical protein
MLMSKQTAASYLANRLQHHLIIARDKDPNMNMRVLTDAAGHKTAQKLYHQYISDADYSKLPAFVQGLDRLLAQFGAGSGNKAENAEDEESDKVPVKDGKDKF